MCLLLTFLNKALRNKKKYLPTLISKRINFKRKVINYINKYICLIVE